MTFGQEQSRLILESNDAQNYELRKKFMKLKERNDRICLLFSASDHEFDYYRDFQAGCTTDSVKFQKLVDKKAYMLFWLD